LIDSCWGAGFLEGSSYTQRFTPRWFTSTNDEFGKSHFPTDEQYQIREDGTVQTWKEYILAPARPVELQQFDELMYASESLRPREKYIEGGRTHEFRIGKVCEHLEMGAEEEGYTLLVFTSDRNGKNAPISHEGVMERHEEGGWSTRIYVPETAGMATMFVVNSWDGRDGRGLTPAELRKGIGRKAMGFQGVARWEVR
jgi:hypothetical protein